MRFYLSFAGETFLGAVITEADTPEAALQKVTRLGLNPGGEVMILPGGSDRAMKYADRLLTKEEVIMAFDAPVVRYADLNNDEKKMVDDSSTHVCEECNRVHLN